MKSKEYRYDNDQDILSFENGELNVSAYSYCIDSFGYVELDKQETKELYEAMKE